MSHKPIYGLLLLVYHYYTVTMLPVPPWRKKKAKFEPRAFKQPGRTVPTAEGSQTFVQSLAHTFHSHRADDGTQLQHRTLGSFDIEVADKTPLLTVGEGCQDDSIFDFSDGQAEEAGDSGSDKEEVVQISEVTKVARVSHGLIPSSKALMCV